MWIYHLDDGSEMAMRLVHENGKLVEKLVPVEEEVARMRAARKAKEPMPEVEPSPEPRPKPSLSPLEATIIAARRGLKEVLPRLRQVLDAHPELWQHFGNLALQAQESWLGLIAGKDLYLAESLRRHLDAMRSELVGPNPSPLDKLLVDRILACHVQVLYFEAMETMDPTSENMRLAPYRMDRRDQAHRQFLSAVKMLATVRNLAAKTNVIQVELLSPVTPHSSAQSVIPTANGDQPQGRNGCNGKNRIDAEAAKTAKGDQPATTRCKAKHAKKVNGNGSAQPINGHNRLNGNRLSDLLGTVACD